MVKALDNDKDVNVFELQLVYNVDYQTNIFGKVMNTFIAQAKGVK